jgi:hypothetical protein
MELCCGTVDRRSWASSISALNMLCLPYEILQQISFIFGQEKMFPMIKNLFEIMYQFSPFNREPRRRGRYWAPLNEAAQRDINLLILSRC